MRIIMKLNLQKTQKMDNIKLIKKEQINLHLNRNELVNLVKLLTNFLLL